VKVRGLDRVVVFARDMDRALALFSGLLGLEFDELPPDDADGCRVAVSPDGRLELMALADRRDVSAPHVMRWVDALGGAELGVAALCFRVDDVMAVAGELRTAGVTVETDLAFPDLEPLPMYNVRELLLAARDTGGMSIGLVQYDDSPEGERTVASVSDHDGSDTKEVT
jgi:catechol 2,3-dioxygenase-like lactoylglutathione lyase family enzyme